jgi:hypothetical protein
MRRSVTQGRHWLFCGDDSAIVTETHRISVAITPRVRRTVFALVALMVLMPPLVRATRSPAGDSPLQIRLNRGFHLPETRWDGALPQAPLTIAALFEPWRPASPVLVSQGEEPLPESRAPLPIDSLRGPPATLNI